MNYINNANKYPYLTDLINNGGGLNIEYTYQLEVVAFAFDEGGTVWEGKREYDSIEALLDDAEAGVKEYADKNW